MPLLQYFRLVHVMAWMALRADASKFFLGYIWWALEPLLWVSVLYVVFTTLLVQGQPDFLIFLSTGQMIFLWFSKSITQAASSIVNAQGLIGNIDIPKTLFPMAVVHEGLYRQCAVFVLLFVFLALNGYTVTATWWYLLPLMVVSYMMILAGAFIGACLVCLMRDFAQLIGLGMMFLMFVSGVFWDVRALPDKHKIDVVLNLNPVAFVLDAYRQVLMHDTAPNMPHLLAIMAGAGVLIYVLVIVMRRSSQFLALKAITA
jgi:lipopolysaccharide transport system permease protein